MDNENKQYEKIGEDGLVETIPQPPIVNVYTEEQINVNIENAQNELNKWQVLKNKLNEINK